VDESLLHESLTYESLTHESLVHESLVEQKGRPAKMLPCTYRKHNIYYISQ